MTSADQPDRRFPWVYFVAALLPIGLIAAIFSMPLFLSPQESMGSAMACAMLIGPVAGLVFGWGVVRLLRGDAERYPALRWLVWLPAAVGVIGFVAG
jgi:uncharacterized membrane protein